MKLLNEQAPVVDFDKELEVSVTVGELLVINVALGLATSYEVLQKLKTDNFELTDFKITPLYDSVRDILKTQGVVRNVWD